jgi:type IV secretion system protein TrbL
MTIAGAGTIMILAATDFGDGGPQLINDIIQKYVDAINHGFGLIRGDVRFILNVLVIISVVWSAMLWMFSDDHVVAHFARKVIYIGIFVWIIENWQMLTDKMARSFTNLGLKAGGFSDANTYTSQPGDILYLCYDTIDPIVQQIVRLADTWTFYKNLGQILFLTLAVAAIIVAFFTIVIQLAMALLTFKFGSLVSFILIPFGVLTKTAFISERPLGWVVGSGIRLMVLTIVLGVANNIFNTLAPKPGATITIYEAFTIALAALLLMMISFVATRLATDLIIGGPSLGVGSTVNQAAAVYQTGATPIAKPAVLATKAAAAITTKGTTLVAEGSTRITNVAQSNSTVRKPTATKAEKSSPMAATTAVQRLNGQSRRT